MPIPDYAPLIAEISNEYARRSPRSAAINELAQRVLVDGGSHALRLLEPFPPRIASAHGAWLTDEDAHRILDFWQGHFANVLGHNPEIVTSELASAFERGAGLQTGFTDRLQVETAEILCRQVGAERVRFTTSGSLATMYAILLARAHTGRDLVMKVGGGWHGAHPWGLKGVSLHFGPEGAETGADSAGLPSAFLEDVVVAGFNDPELLRDLFREYGGQTACLIVEPFIGSGGFIMATREFLAEARELTEKHGALLILDEVISGFRFRAGDLGRLLGVQPDLATFGKVMGGGMPVAAVAGRADVMNQVGRAGGSTVKFSGGTYSAHPASMLAAKAMMSYLAANESVLYPQLALLGDRARQAAENAFASEGVLAKCTGSDEAGQVGSSLFKLHFPCREDQDLDRPEVVFDPSLCDVALSDRVVQLGMLLEDVHLMRGRGAVSEAHTEADIAAFGEACRRVAQRVREFVRNRR